MTSATSVRVGLVLLQLLALTACAGFTDKAEEEEARRSAFEYALDQNIRDDRGRFREYLCAVLEARGDSVPDARPCEEALTPVGEEQGATGQPVALGPAEANFLVLFVPGLGWECFEEWLDYEGSGPRHIAQFGYEMRKLTVDGLSSSDNNARQIRDHILGLPPEDSSRPLILMGYSKGAPDILTALVDYPELQERVNAVVSIAGAVAGSPLANAATQDEAGLLTKVPGSKCDYGDHGAIDSLRTDVRQQWLEDNPLPQSVDYFSVVTLPDEDRVSWILQNSYLALSALDARNDTQVLIAGQMIPGSTLLAFVNADHWAMAVPVARQHPFVGSTLVNHNDYPREAFLEALMRYLDDYLAQR